MEENSYRSTVFLGWLQDPSVDPASRRNWKEHQEMQFSYLLKRGLRPDHRLLDVGCGPLRLGAALLPYLRHGWYFGQDINPTTLALGESVLSRSGIDASRCSLIASEDFSFTDLEDHSIDVAFSNSLFSHLTMNSILRCLLRLGAALKPDGVYYSTFFLVPSGSDWNQPILRNKWGRQFNSNPCSDPYHYTEAMIASLAHAAGFSFLIDPEFAHPTQTMALFRPLS